MPGSISARRFVVLLAGAVVFRYACFLVMTRMALWNEARPAPRVPDLIIDAVPFTEWISDWNYRLWLIAFVPVTFVLMAKAPRRAIRFLITGGLLSVIRGICITLTGLGPVRGPDHNVGIAASAQWEGTWAVASPLGAFVDDRAFVYLTKDLFFSGHVATTFLLLLYVWPIKPLRYLTIVMHLLVVVSVFFAHLHYTIDVVGAYAITFCLFVFREGHPAAGLGVDSLARAPQGVSSPRAVRDSA
ncbi:MAG: phosphatase PAP2 family protein [Planctomycetes bacterium]|nr:phosphatase PAP2 family protein [Planctomycetota bacterium]